MLAKKAGETRTPAERSFGLGSTAECLESLAGQLVSIFLTRCKRLKGIFVVQSLFFNSRD